jgi:hypothetical protein
VRLGQAGCRRVERVFSGGTVVCILPNDRPADRQSSVAIVMLGRAQPHNFGGHGVDIVEGKHKRLPVSERGA